MIFKYLNSIAELGQSKADESQAGLHSWLSWLPGYKTVRRFPRKQNCDFLQYQWQGESRRKGGFY